MEFLTENLSLHLAKFYLEGVSLKKGIKLYTLFSNPQNRKLLNSTNNITILNVHVTYKWGPGSTLKREKPVVSLACTFRARSSAGINPCSFMDIKEITPICTC